MNPKRIFVVKKQVLVLSQNAEKEHDELAYILNKIQTSVDFISSCVEETITQWKQGKAFRDSTLEDLKFKFRLDTFSVDDGWGLYYMYPVWIKRQQDKVLVLLSFLGTDAQESETIDTVINRAEKNEWLKGLDIDMDIIFALKEMRKVLRLTRAMEPMLEQLEVACRKRSAQILAPAWEPRR